MRHSKLLICSLILVIGMLAFNTEVLSSDYPRTNIRFNFGVWDMQDSDLGITVHHTDLGDNERLTDVQVAGISGAFALSHMIGERFAWELSLGGFSDSESHTLSREVSPRYRGDDYYDTISSNTHTVSVSYLTMGIIYYPLQELDGVFGSLSSFFRPYLTAGIGPYFGWDAKFDEDNITDVNFATAMGAYPGVGIDLLLSRHFIFNIDLRYHFVEFGEPLKDLEDYSGLNAVAGFKIAF